MNDARPTQSQSVTLETWLATATARLTTALAADETRAGISATPPCAHRSEARSEAEQLCLTVLERPRSHLYAHARDELEEPAHERLEALLARRLDGVPIAYLLGRREFWSLDLEVTPAVLVPRTETECLVDRALAFLSERPQARVIDAGTGSGAVAIALAHESEARVLAIDRSAAALEVARRNVRRLVGDRVQFVRGDWLDAIGDACCELVLSNPPYLAATDPHLRTAHLRAEPRAALVAGENGLEAIARLVVDAERVLCAGGELWLEHGATQASAVRQLFAERAFDAVRTLPDLAGRDRVTGARRCRDRLAGPLSQPRR